LFSPADLTAWHLHTTARFEASFVAGGQFFPQDNVEATTARVRTFLETLG
jgi:surfactin synthase thioesterase subunit